MPVLLCLRHMLERDGKSPKAQFLLPPSLESMATTEAAVCSLLPVLWVMLCPFTPYVSGKIPTLARSQILIHEVVKFRFAWKGTDSRELGTMDLCLVLPLSFFQQYSCTHLTPAFSITMFILQKTRLWPFKVLKKSSHYFEFAGS